MSDVRSWYLGLPNDKKQVFLAIVAHQLTVHGRYMGYEWSGEQQIKAFKGLNELQHQISSHIAAIGLARNRYPDEVLWDILQEKAGQHQISTQLSEFTSVRAITFLLDRKSVTLRPRLACSPPE